MVHPDNGTLLAFLDGEVTDDEAAETRAHLEECPACRAEADALAAAARGLAEAMALLDSEPDLKSAKARLAQGSGDRLSTPLPGDASGRGRHGSRGSDRFGTFLTLPRAASIALLLTAGTVSALPGSPVRRWITDLVGTPGAQETEGAGLDAPEASAGGIQEESRPGAGIPAIDGSVEIWIHDLPEDSELRIRWTDGQDAWIFAGPETRFNLEDGKLEAFSPQGPVVIEIPRDLPQVVVGLDESILLRKAGDDLEILGPIQQRTPFEILFEPPGPPTPRTGDPNATGS